MLKSFSISVYSSVYITLYAVIQCEKESVLHGRIPYFSLVPAAVKQTEKRKRQEEQLDRKVKLLCFGKTLNAYKLPGKTVPASRFSV